MKFRRLIKEANKTALELSGADFLALSSAAGHTSVLGSLKELEKAAGKAINERG